jgi:hypothetical protein
MGAGVGKRRGIRGSTQVGKHGGRKVLQMVQDIHKQY